jgi:2'-5' RNA ligase
MNTLFQPEIRAFVAVELPAKSLDDLTYLVSALVQEQLSSLQLVKPEKAHLTLKFLGQVPVSRLEEIGKALDRVASNVAPFQIEFEELGGFPNNETPQVLWAGLIDTERRFS